MTEPTSAERSIQIGLCDDVGNEPRLGSLGKNKLHRMADRDGPGPTNWAALIFARPESVKRAGLSLSDSEFGVICKQRLLIWPVGRIRLRLATG